MTAQVTDADAFGLSQAGLSVRVPVGRAEWVWPVRDLARDGSTVTMTVGPLE